MRRTRIGASAIAIAIRCAATDVVVAEFHRIAVARILIVVGVYRIEGKVRRVAGALLGACKRSEKCEASKEQR